MGRKYGFSFSWKRASGLSGAKASLSRKIGIPLTRSGMERKIGRAVLGGSGCCIPMAFLISIVGAIVICLIMIF